MARVKKVKKNVPQSWEEALQFYLMWKKAEGIREITLKGHKDVIGLFYRRHPEAYNDKNAIKELIQSRHPEWNDNVPVFCCTEGTPLTRHTWNDRLEMYSKMLGVKVRVRGSVNNLV